MSLLRSDSDELQLLRERVNRLFEQTPRAHETAPRLWAPAVDVIETSGEIVLQAELPGMRKEDIDIELTGSTLTLQGERRLAPARPGEQVHRIERQSGGWQRTFQIDTPIDASQVRATYEDGVLTLRLPKQEAAASRQISIGTGEARR